MYVSTFYWHGQLGIIYTVIFKSIVHINLRELKASVDMLWAMSQRLLHICGLK